MFKKIAKGTTAASAVALIAMPVTAHYEGLRLKAYLDPVGIPTICYGETEGVKLGQSKTKKECDALFASRLGAFAYAVDYVITTDMSEKTHAALTSFSYNVGIGAFSRSTLVKYANNGEWVKACNELPKWNKAKGKILLGLIKRRDAERELCLSGL